MKSQVSITDDLDAKRKRSSKLLIVIIVFLIAALAVSIAFLTSSNRQSNQPAANLNGVGLVVDPDAGKYVMPVTEKAKSRPEVAIPGWGSITIPPMTTELDGMVDFFNPEKNAGQYYLTFELRLPNDSDCGYEVLYTSQLVPPGQHIQSIKLNRGLPKGEYKAIIHVQPYCMDANKTPTNNANMNTVLVVK